MISEFKSLYDQRADIANEWKKQNGKVVGFFNSLTPQEMIHAAGALPVLIQDVGMDITEARRYLPEFLCPTLKDCLAQAMDGKLNYIDGTVMAHLCEGMRGFYGVWEKNSGLPAPFLIQVPATSGEGALAFYIEECRNLKRYLEDLTGNQITDEALKQAVTIYNENRALIKKLYEFRIPPQIRMKGSEIVDVLNAGLIMPKEKHNEMLKKIIDEKTKDPVKDQANESLRFYLISNELSEAKIIMNAIEKLEGNVVSDNLAYGLRYSNESVAMNGDPIRSLAEHYLNKMPCPGKFRSNVLVNKITESIMQLQCNGVIWSVEKYCDPYLFEFPIFQQSMKEKGIHLLKIEAEDVCNSGRLKTKLEAFMEMLK